MRSQIANEISRFSTVVRLWRVCVDLSADVAGVVMALIRASVPFAIRKEKVMKPNRPEKSMLTRLRRPNYEWWLVKCDQWCKIGVPALKPSTL
jgi:hypothetical protein